MYTLHAALHSLGSAARFCPKIVHAYQPWHQTDLTCCVAMLSNIVLLLLLQRLSVGVCADGCAQICLLVSLMDPKQHAVAHHACCRQQACVCVQLLIEPLGIARLKPEPLLEVQVLQNSASACSLQALTRYD